MRACLIGPPLQNQKIISTVLHPCWVCLLRTMTDSHQHLALANFPTQETMVAEAAAGITSPDTGVETTDPTPIRVVGNAFTDASGRLVRPQRVTPRESNPRVASAPQRVAPRSTPAVTTPVASSKSASCCTDPRCTALCCQCSCSKHPSANSGVAQPRTAAPSSDHKPLGRHTFGTARSL